MALPRPSGRLKNAALALLLTAFAVALALIRLAANGVPAVPAGTAAGRPDPARLEAHVRALAAEPHPIGAAAHERARRYVLDTLRAEGIETTAQDASAVSPVYAGFSTAGRVRNVIARLPGRPGADAILIAGHYDSVSTGPGAADDASAVAGMIEAARLLKADGPPRNDVVFLFSDGEEIGLAGAEAFADESPLMAKVRAAFNFEARGTRGPVLLFETGPGSAGLVRAFLAADPHPLGTSLATTVYQFLPNNTDFTVFKERGLPGLNFACIGDLPAYHTRLDNPARLDPRTLYLQAEHVLTCARVFGNADLSFPGGGDVVFFPLCGSLVLNYSRLPAALLAAATIAALAAAWVVGLRARLISIKKTLLAGGAILLLAAVSGGLALGANLLLGALHPENRSLAEPYNASWYRIALGLLPLFPALLIRRLWGRRLSPIDLFSGGCLTFALLLAVTAAALPGVSYLFQWPFFFAVPLLAFLLWREKKPLPPAVGPAVIALLCAPVLMLGVDTFALASDAVTLAFCWAFVPLLALLLALAWPFLDLVLDRGRALFPLLATAALAAAVAAGTLTSGFSADRPLPETVAYGLDADKGEAYWIACPDAPDPWSGQFFAGRSSVGPLPAFSPLAPGCLTARPGFRRAPAPAVDLPAPLLTLRSAVPGARGRELTLLLRSPRGARHALVYIRRRPGTGDVAIDGKKITETPIEKLKPAYQFFIRQLDYRNWIMISFFGLPVEGVELRLTAPANEPVTIKAIDTTGGLPERAVRGFRPRPPESMPGESLVVPNGTMVAKEYRF